MARWTDERVVQKLPTLRDAIVFIQSLDGRQLETLRNEVEISIYHAEDQLSFEAKYAWFVCAIAAFVGVLGKDAIALIVCLIVAGFAYTVRSLESRRVALVLLALGALVAVDLPYKILAPGQPHELEIAFAVNVVLLGAASARTVSRLRNLRAFRSLIPLPPAKHLEDPPSNSA